MRMLVLGKTQSGKSHWIYHYIYPQFLRSHFCIYIDPKPSTFVRPSKKGLQIYSIDQTTRKRFWMPIEMRPEEVRELILKPHLSTDFEDETDKLLWHVIGKKMSGHKDPVLIIIDEAHRFGSKHSFMASFGKIVKEGEAHNISTIIITQAPTEISNTLILNCEFLAMFGYSPQLVEYAKKNFQIDLDEKDIAWLKGQYHGIFYNWQNLHWIHSGMKKKIEARGEI